MKEAVKLGRYAPPVWLLISLTAIAGIAAAAAVIAHVRLGYVITPPGGTGPTFTPDPLNLDLGSMPSGSSGVKDFGKVATLELPVGYEVTFTLDRSTASDFATFNVDIVIYELGEPVASYWIYLYNSEVLNSDSAIMAAGTYDVQVEITYTAVSVTSETSGTVEIDVSYPG